MRDPYAIAIVGPSGRGKTYSLRNLDPDTTAIINIESKPLPFPNNFNFYYRPKNWSEAYDLLIELAKNDKIKTVVLESFTEYTASLLKTARDIKRNFEIWNYYNQKVGELNYVIRRYPKDIIVTAHSEKVEVEGNIVEERISIKGKEWKQGGGVERDYTLVLYADVDISDDSNRSYFFRLNSDGIISAKTPPVLFDGKETIENDCSLVLKEIDDKFNTKK